MTNYTLEFYDSETDEQTDLNTKNQQALIKMIETFFEEYDAIENWKIVLTCEDKNDN